MYFIFLFLFYFYIFFVCYLYLIQLADVSMCEGTDTMKIRVSDQSDAMLYFPHDKSAEVFASHPRTTVTARQEGSGPTHCNEGQLTLTIMPLLLNADKSPSLLILLRGDAERE